MSDNVNYHKLEADDSASSATPAWTGPQTTRGRSSWQTWARLAGEVLLVFMVLSLSLKVALADRSTSFGERGRNEPRETFGYVEKVFMNDTRYANEDAFMSEENLEKTLKEWLPLSSKGRGYVRVAEDQRTGFDGPPYRLNPLLRGQVDDAYMVSGMHQLHCLSMIMASYGRLRQGQDQSEKGYHIAHCFDYLRQGILCAGDMTLEGNNSVTYPGVDVPWGTAHKCLDWSALIGWADDRTIWSFPPGLDVL